MVNKKDILFGLLRLRFFGKEAIVRELHVYGQALKLGDKGLLNPQEGTPKYFFKKYLQGAQHLGLGKKLMMEAERLAKENGFEKIAVISGVGVRDYYRKLGYSLVGDYMVKDLTKN